jgi:hypothetical protein
MILANSTTIMRCMHRWWTTVTSRSGSRSTRTL